VCTQFIWYTMQLQERRKKTLQTYWNVLERQLFSSARELTDRLLSVPLPVNFYIFDFIFRTMGPVLTRLGTIYPWGERIQVYSNEGEQPSPMGDKSKTVNIHWKFRNLTLQNQQANFNQTWYKSSLGKGNSMRRFFFFYRFS
jgi:hypothetical protein